jgi:methionine-rich copper-binding protein CopC
MRELVRSRPITTALTLGFLALGALWAAPAQANTVISTAPTIGAVLTQAPNAVSVTAATALLPDGNSLTVQDPNQLQVDDGSLTISDTTAVVGLKPLAVTGIYTVTYTLLSATDAPVSGSYTFLYNAPAVISTPSSAPTAVVTPTGVGIKNPSSSSANVAVLVFLGLATIVALFLIWYARLIWIQSRKSRRRRVHERGEK